MPQAACHRSVGDTVPTLTDDCVLGLYTKKTASLKRGVGLESRDGEKRTESRQGESRGSEKSLEKRGVSRQQEELREKDGVDGEGWILAAARGA